jgi:hypothetical protein
MPTQLLSIGYPQSIIQNQIYALPSRKCTLFCDTAAVTLFQANDLAFTAPFAITLTGGQSQVAGGFLKCTSAGPVLVSLKTD